ncbi:MAG: 23S rRNA (guanosine(2251)-2'-O)-methyltransferase RlmB [Pseudomonadota bacterium]|nr:23S rRNA (guanosine(2251)-2'-O)-methyltransferase RlmB [Pseudomonadota bacterium]
MSHTQKNNKDIYLFGRHPIELALKNKRRQILELYHTSDALSGIRIPMGTKTRCVDRSFLDTLVGKDALHQGLVARVVPLSQPTLDEMLKAVASKETALVIILDQITDPHNIGAILRSAAAFDVDAVIVPETGTPAETGTLAKSASGALELIPMIRVSNLIRAMEKLKKADFWCIGLDGYASDSITGTKLPKRCAFVMGSEGDGMRRLTQENCDYSVRLPMNPVIESLNVSNAAALTLYEFRRQYPAT